MKYVSAHVISLCLLLLCAACASNPSATTSGTPWNAEDASRSVVGNWVVDLRATPDGAPYSQPFVITSVDVAGRSIKGSFYSSEITWSRINTAWGKLVVTFITSDGQGEYTHTATLERGVLIGTSTARHRNLLVPWTAQRAP